MPGTLLRDDWRSSVEDELRKHVQGLQQPVQQAFQVVQDAPRPDPQQVLQELQQHVQQIAQPAQQAIAPVVQFGQEQVQQPAQQAQQGVVQFGQQQQQNVQDVQADLQNYVSQVIQSGPRQPEVQTAPPAAEAAPPIQAAGPGGALQDYARQAARGVGLDPEIFVRQIQQESGFNPNAGSPAGARGVAQFMPGTAEGVARQLGVSAQEFWADPQLQLRGAAQHMADLKRQFGTDELALAAYNAGAGAVQKYGGIPPFEETQRYVRTILGVDGARAPSTQPSLPHTEEPATATDSLGDKWKTQFGFQATYTGSYRTGTPHRGVDLVPQQGGIGTSIEAFHPGTVTQISRDTGGAGGLMVYVKDRDGLTHAYMHLADTRPGLKVGDLINRGDFLATMGESGTEGSPHLHYEVRRGLSGDPLDQLIDPRPYMAGAAPGATTARDVGGGAPVFNLGDQQRPPAKEPLIAGGRAPYEEPPKPGFQVVGDVAAGIGERIGGAVQQTVQDISQSGLGDQLLRQGRTQAEQGEYRIRQQEEYSRLIREGAERRLQPEQSLDLGQIAGGAAQLMLTGGENLPRISLPDYQDMQSRIGAAIDAGNPLRDWFFVGGLSSEAAKIGMSGQWLLPIYGIGRAAQAAIVERTGSQLAGRLTEQAITNGIQNTLFEFTKRNPTPESVGEAFAIGAGLGAAADLGVAGVGKAGRVIMDNLPDVLERAGPGLRDVLTNRQRAELTIGPRPGERPPPIAEGVPEPVATPPTPEARAAEAAAPVPPALRPAEELGGFRAPEAEPSRRMYHGTAGEYSSVVLGQRALEGENSLGHGHYLATDPGEASAYAERAQSFNPNELEGFVGTGANVRAVDVPASMRLFDLVKTDLDMDSVEIRRLADMLERQGGGSAGEAASELRYLADIADPTAKLGGDASPNVVFDAMRSRGIEPREISRLVRQLGYEGIEHIDLLDGAHNVVIFPEALPKIRNAISGRQGGQVRLPYALDIGGAAGGAYAGNVATPEDATVEERLRNIGIGAATGLVGGRVATRALERRPGLLAATAGGPSGFRAPERPTLEDQLLQARAREPGGAPPPEGPTPPPPPPRRPRSLQEVESNRYILDEADEGAPSMTDDELVTHYEMLDQRLGDIQGRAEAIEEVLRNPNQKPYRSPGMIGYTDDQVVEIARKLGHSAYDEGWWQAAELQPGSGELKYDVYQSGVSRGGGRTPTPAELRAELKALTKERTDLGAAADQLGTARPGQRFAAREASTNGSADLPFDEPIATNGAVENAGPSGNLAEDIVTKNGTRASRRGLTQEPGQVVGRKGGITGRGITDVEAAAVGEPSERVKAAMPNLDALLKDEMPEVRAQIQKAAEDNIELFEAYNQGRISHDSLKDDLAKKVGMTRADWLKTPVGKGFSTPELVALQAAAIEAMDDSKAMARQIMNRGGVDKLTNEEVAFGLTTLIDATRLMAVARGGRASAGRSLNALKIRLDAEMARGIGAANERVAARREADAARRGVERTRRLLNKTRELEQEADQAVKAVRETRAPKNVEQEIVEAYEQLDRYQAMSLHEKGADFDRLAKERADRAAARKAKVRAAPEELLSALRAELKAERDIFAGRKDTWETQAFWDSKQAEQAAEKRMSFRGGLYLEQQRKAANEALKANEQRAVKAWEDASRRQTRQTEKAGRLLEAIGGEKPTRELLKAFTEAIASDDPMVAAKFLKGLDRPRTGFGWVVEAARNANVMRLAGMLSSTATHIINAGGNVIQLPLEVATRAAVVGVDIPRAALRGGERQAYAAELLPMMKAYGPGFLAGLPDALRLLKTGIAPAEVADLSKLRPGFRSGLPGAVGRAVDPAIEMPLRVLQASDILFRGGAFASHAQRVAVRRATQEGFRGAQRTGRANTIVANLEDFPELYTEAAEAAARMVYQERRTVPLLSGIRPKGTAADVGELAVSQAIPFRTTPANIFAQGAGLSPLGFLSVGEAAGRRGELAARVASGEIPKERVGRQTLLAEERAARAGIGSAILGAAIWYGSMQDEHGKPMGKLTAMYDEDEASTYPPGWRAWSIRQENPVTGEMTYVPYQNFGAAGVPLAMAALWTDSQRRGKTILQGDELVRATTGLGRYAIDNTFLQGLSDVVDLLHDPARAGGKFVEGLVSSYGPYSAMGRQIQRAQGEASRNPREGMLGLLDALEANYPGVSENVPEATTPLGEPRVAGASGLGAIVGRYDIERDQPTLRALRAVDVNVPQEPKSVAIGGGYGVELTETERDRLKRARGTVIKQSVETTLKNPSYQKLEAALQREQPGSAAYNDALSRAHAAMQAAVSGAAQSANNDFLRTLGDAEMRRRMKVTRELEPAYIGAAAD